MSVSLPESNQTLLGVNPTAYILPTGKFFKPANTGFVTAFWMKTPAGGYDQNVSHVLLAKGTGGTGGADGFISANQAVTTLSARWRNAGVDYLGTTGVTATIVPGVTYLIMFIVTPTFTYLVACQPGGSPIITATAQSTLYALNMSATDCWTSLGYGNGATISPHYGPLEEFCFWTGSFPETSAGVPNSTLIQNIANGTQSLSTLDASLAAPNVAKKCRFRLLTADTLSDDFGVAGNLTATGATADRVIMSHGPLRPAALTPGPSAPCASQLTFVTPGSTTGATAVIRTGAGTYTGSPFAIQARLIKEDRSVLTPWETVATPSGGTWPEGRFAAAQPYTAGWLEVQYRAVDNVGTQVGDIIAGYGLRGTGINIIAESQSQLMVMFTTGASGVVTPASSRGQLTYFVTTPSVAVITKALCADSPVTRSGQGVRQFIAEVNALFPGMPVSLNAVGVVGTPITDYLAGGTYVGNWAALKAFLGVTQPFYLVLFGHSATGGESSATYETEITAIQTIARTNFGNEIRMILCPTARYAGTGTNTQYTADAIVRTAMRDYVVHNPGAAVLGGSWQTVKCDASDIGPHPANLSVGQGRSGSYLAFAVLAACRAVKQQPLQIKSATPSGTTIRLKMGPVNAL